MYSLNLSKIQKKINIIKFTITLFLGINSVSTDFMNLSTPYSYNSNHSFSFNQNANTIGSYFQKFNLNIKSKAKPMNNIYDHHRNSFDHMFSNDMFNEINNKFFPEVSNFIFLTSRLIMKIT